MVKGIDLTGKLDNPVCEACAAGKMTDMAHTGTISPGTRFLELVHVDLCGPITPDGLLDNKGPFKYFMMFTDDWSKFS
jgi:hypothetical protein